MDYKELTIKDLVKYVRKHKDMYPRGLDTPITSGDFECNCTHGKHEIQNMNPDDEHIFVPTICLAYEMHENIYDN